MHLLSDEPAIDVCPTVYPPMTRLAQQNEVFRISAELYYPERHNMVDMKFASLS
jgi:hypothetical protein